jgi:hypothetical protein
MYLCDILPRPYRLQNRLNYSLHSKTLFESIGRPQFYYLVYKLYKMAAASVLIPIDTISQNGGTLPPSALIQHSPRHGRSRAASMKGKNRYNVQENRDVAIYKAVSFVLKRTLRQEDIEDASEDEENDRLISDNNGWVAMPDLVCNSSTVAITRRTC